VVLAGAAILVALGAGRTARLTWTLRGSLVAGTLLATLAATFGAGTPWMAVADLWLAAIMLLAVVVVLRRVLRQPVVTADTVFAALAAYLLGGFMFAALFGTVALVGPQPFFRQGGVPSGSDLLYFSFVTLTTTGYGDLTPAQPLGRSLAVLEALAGQFFMATLVARLVSLLGSARPSSNPDSNPDSNPNSNPNRKG
jgi:hypothetical protein